MMRFISLFIAVIVITQSCQKDFPFEEQPLPDNGCRISKMTWIWDSAEVSTFSFIYDGLNRISSITSAPYEDTIYAYYEGTATKLKKIRFSETPDARPETEIIYNADNKLTEFTAPRFKSKMFYKNGRIDSADLFAKVRVTDPDWEMFRSYNFFYNQGNRIIGYKAELDGYGDSSTLEYTTIKNPLRHLLFFNADDFLSMGHVFPLSHFGYVDDFLLKKETEKTYHLRPDPILPVTYGKAEYEFTYDFDEKNNLRMVEQKIFAMGRLHSTQTFQFEYECK